MIKDYGIGWRFWDRMLSFWVPFPVDRTPQSQFSRKTRSKEWSIFHAPTLSDIQWENYGLSFLPWYLRAIMINFTVILLALFFSTPIIVIRTINHYVSIREKRGTVVTRQEGLVSQ